VNTGEVVTGTEERLATGDAVNVAARLEQAAQPREPSSASERCGKAHPCHNTTHVATDGKNTCRLCRDFPWAVLGSNQ